MASIKFKNEQGEWEKVDLGEQVATFNGRYGDVAPQAGDYTADMVGAAPAGKFIDDCNAAVKTGFYLFDGAANAPFAYGTLIVSERYAGLVNQIAHCNAGNDAGKIAVRHNDGAWSAWQTIYHTGNKPTAADVGAAPAGYGLGDWAKILAPGTDLNIVVKTGWYGVLGTEEMYGLGNVPTVFKSGAGLPLLRVEALTAGWIIQTFYRIDETTKKVLSKAVRQCASTTWSEWEYENPPMQLGVEYRTTERYLGKPVYVMLVDFGTLPNTSEKYVVYTTDTNVLPFFTCGRTNETGASLPGIDLTKRTTMINIYAGKNIIYAKTTEDYSARSATVLVKYTKDTD